MKIFEIAISVLAFCVLGSSVPGFAQSNFGTDDTHVLEIESDVVIPIVPDPQIMSCSHFQARLKNQVQTVGELSWPFDESTNEDELARFLSNRLAANPYWFAGERAAEVKWSIPKSAISTKPQVFGIFEEADMDFQGAQMHFEAPGRKLSVSADGIEVQSPVRMFDVCNKGYVDLKFFSRCPIDRFDFWRPEPSTKPKPYAINFPQCKKVETVRLKLDHVESTLEENKLKLNRGGDQLPISVGSAPDSCNDDQASNAARILENLLPVKRLHNCAIDVAKRVANGKSEYSIYLRDEFSCHSKTFDCHETEFSLTVPSQCVSQSVLPRTNYTNKVERASETQIEIMQTLMNRDRQIMGLSITKMNSKTGKRADHVVCQPDIFKVQYEN